MGEPTGSGGMRIGGTVPAATTEAAAVAGGLSAGIATGEGGGGDPGDEEHRRSRPRTRGGGGGRDGDHGRRGRRFRWTRADGVSSRGRSGKATMDAWYASVERATALEGLAAAADVFADGGNDGGGGGGSGDLGDGALELGGGAVVSADQDAAWGPGGDGWLGVASVLPVGHWARDHVEGWREVLRETVGLLGLLAARGTYPSRGPPAQRIARRDDHRRITPSPFGGLSRSPFRHARVAADNDASRLRASTAPSGGGGGYTALGGLHVDSPDYRSTTAAVDATTGRVAATPRSTVYHFRTNTRVRRTGLLQVGWGGGNGSTLTGAIVASRANLTWALTQAATVRVGLDAQGAAVTVPLREVLPMGTPEALALGGWDISGASLADAADRAGVFEPDLRRQLRPLTADMVPMRGAYDPAFIADNQAPRADHVMPAEWTKQQRLDALRSDIVAFKAANDVEVAVVVWTAGSERCAEERSGLNDTADALLAAIARNEAEVSPSTLYAVAAILEGCPFVNGSPKTRSWQGRWTSPPARAWPSSATTSKSGQTKMKSVLVDYLIGCGVKVKTMVTYNHLGNNDMYQLTDGVMWKPKSAAKSRVIDDIVDGNGLLYPPGTTRPDHVVVVKYVPFLGDSKRDVSGYTSEAFMDAHSTSVLHSACLDSALCAPLILDLALLAGSSPASTLRSATLRRLRMGRPTSRSTRCSAC
ncbi:hypothetical protein MMPV_007015 [Pyropia vietnamensis]